MWGWNPAYTFHGGNTFYYMRLAWQRGCKFVVVDPQYRQCRLLRRLVDSRSNPTPTPPCWPGWPTTSSPTRCRTRSSSTSSAGAWTGNAAQGEGQGKLQGTTSSASTTTRQDAGMGRKICGVYRPPTSKTGRSLRHQSRPALKAFPGRRPRQLRRAVQPHGGGAAGDDRQHRHPRRLREGVGRAGTRGGGLSLRRSTPTSGGFDQVRPLGPLRAQLPQRQARGSRLLAAQRQRNDGKIPNIKGIFWQGLGLVQPAHQHQQGNQADQEARAGGLHGFDHHAVGPVGRRACCPSPPTSNARTWPCPGTRALLHPPAQGHRAAGRVQDRFPGLYRLAYRLGFKDLANATTPAKRDYFQNPTPPTRPTRQWWVDKVQKHQGVNHALGDLQRNTRVYKFSSTSPTWPLPIRSGKSPSRRRPGKIEIFSTDAGRGHRLDEDPVGLSDSPFPSGSRPFESLNHAKAKKFPFHMVTPHPRAGGPSIFHNIPGCGNLPAGGDHQRPRRRPARTSTGDIVESGTTAARSSYRPTSPSAAWAGGSLRRGLDGPRRDGTDRSGQPRFPHLDEPSPARRLRLQHHPWSTGRAPA